MSRRVLSAFPKTVSCRSVLGLASGISARHDPFVCGEMGMLFVHYWPMATAVVTVRAAPRF